MGYYTEFSLKIYNEKGELISSSDRESYEKVKETFLDSISWMIGGDFDSLVDGNVTWKWYDSTRDMKEIARKLPEYYFILEGRGEENDDWWTFAIHNIDIHNDEVVPPASHFIDFWNIE